MFGKAIVLWRVHRQAWIERLLRAPLAMGKLTELMRLRRTSTVNPPVLKALPPRSSRNELYGRGTSSGNAVADVRARKREIGELWNAPLASSVRTTSKLPFTEARTNASLSLVFFQSRYNTFYSVSDTW